MSAREPTTPQTSRAARAIVLDALVRMPAAEIRARIASDCAPRPRRHARRLAAVPPCASANACADVASRRAAATAPLTRSGAALRGGRSISRATRACGIARLARGSRAARRCSAVAPRCARLRLILRALASGCPVGVCRVARRAAVGRVAICRSVSIAVLGTHHAGRRADRHEHDRDLARARPARSPRAARASRTSPRRRPGRDDVRVLDRGSRRHHGSAPGVQPRRARPCSRRTASI